MSDKTAEEMYNAFKDRYSLPDFKQVQVFLEISSFEDENQVLPTIRKKVYEKLNKILEVLDPIVQPEGTAVSMYENSFFSEQERSECFEIYKNFMALIRHSDLLMLEEDEEKNAEFINTFFKAFKENKATLEKIISKQKNCWSTNSNINNKVLNYFG
ncbi:MAG: hypothetical protein ACOCZ6_01245 [Nanoarchaeota archaeon]